MGGEPTTVKCIVVGDSAAGKTSLLHRFTKNQFSAEHLHTIGVEFASRVATTPRGSSVKMCVWDTAGQEKYKSVTRSYYRGAAACFVVYDMSRAESFEHVRQWLSDVRQYAHPGASVVLMGNKSDLAPGQRAVAEAAGRQLAEECGLVAFFETSARTGINVEAAFLAGAEAALDGPVVAAGVVPSPAPGGIIAGSGGDGSGGGSCPC